LFVIWKTLCLRKQLTELFTHGEYLPLQAQGAKANHLVAFLRRNDQASVLVTVPRLVTGLLNDVDIPPTGHRVWDDTRIFLPETPRHQKCKSLLTGKVVDAGAQILAAE